MIGSNMKRVIALIAASAAAVSLAACGSNKHLIFQKLKTGDQKSPVFLFVSKSHFCGF